MRARAARWLTEQILAAVRPRVDERAVAWGELAAAAAATAAAAGALGAAIEQEIARREPFAADTTVHSAWARHPGVRAIFAELHLTDCPSCAVGADETLEEVALGYQVPLDALLASLNALI